ncbi:MAG: hypothetical protein EBR09_12095 [Proteobacteria bacterium]|nr:hypothetical protein [Pseudomonadota bacterium]
MNSQNHTSLEGLKIENRASAFAGNSTFVGDTKPSFHSSMNGLQTMRTSPLRRTSAGMILFKSIPLIRCAPVFARLPSTLSLRPYAQTLELLRRHQNTLRKNERDPHLHISIAWMSLAGSSIEFNRRALESFGLSLRHTLFLETAQPQQGIEALCAETQFDAIVAELPAHPVILKRAQRWLKPAAHDPLKPEPANTLETHPRERLFILIEDNAGTVRGTPSGRGGPVK